MLKSKILFLMTGSIACYKACSVLSKLTQLGHEVQVVATHGALQFVGAATIEGLTGKNPVTDIYSPHHMMDHIHLMRWADLIIVAPATAHVINKFASGMGEDLLTTLFLAHDFKKPFLIAPAMNTAMYEHPITQASLKKLSSMGLTVLSTNAGSLACGEVGSGRLAEPEQILEKVLENLKSTSQSTVTPQKTSAIKVLITAGGTQEPIDNVRSITNTSTGGTAAKLADTLIEVGFDVTYLHAQNAIQPQFSCAKDSFVTFSDLEKKLPEHVKANQVVIHCAAVSDFSLKEKFSGKVSSQEELTLNLKKNPKLIDQIKTWNQKTILVGFKLTSDLSADEQLKAVAKLEQNTKADLVVHNDTAQITSQNHLFQIFKSSQKINTASSSGELSHFLASYLWNEFSERKNLWF